MADLAGTLDVGPAWQWYSGGKQGGLPGQIGDYVAGGGRGGGGAAPVIDNFDPPVGTPLNRSDFVSFDVTDDTGLRRVGVHVALGADVFVVHDGDSFRGRFTNFSTRAAKVGGFRYTVKPNGGWTAAPTFAVSAIDTSGNEAV